MSVTIRTYLCNKKLVALQYSSIASRPALKISGGVVRAKLSLIGEDPKKHIVKASIIKDGTSLVYCVRDRTGGAVLSWERKLVGLELNPRLSRYITVKANIPDLPCHWKQTDVYTINLSPADHHLVFNARADTTGGMIPDSKSDANPLKTDLEFEVTEKTLIPGELLQLAWTLKIDDKIHTGPVMGSWYALPLITGGKVISMNDETNMYTVQVQGVYLDCLPTDWAGYQIGDWVFVLKPEYDGTLKPKEYSWDPDEHEPYIDDTKEYGSDNISQPRYGDTGYRILPLNVDFFGNAHGDFEKKEMATSTPEELDKAFKTTQHVGVVTSIDHNAGTASVTIDDSVLEGFFADVPIFYHCPDETTTEGGSAAFAENDEVIVLNEGGGSNASTDDLSVIGFKDELKKCMYIFHIVRDDGVVMSDEYVELEDYSIVAATINYEYASFTGIYDPETETWQGKFEFDPSVDTSGGLFVFFDISGGETLYTQYPYKYTNASQWQPEDRIYPGTYEVAIPYWVVTPTLGVTEDRVMVDAVYPGKYYESDIQYMDLWELRDLVEAEIELPPSFYIKYRNTDESYLGLSKPFFANGGEDNYTWKVASSVPFTAKTTIRTDRSVPCPHTSYTTPSWNNSLASYMPCGAYAYRPVAPANTPESCCETGEYRVDPVSGWQKRVEEHGCFDVSRYDDSGVDALIRQGKIQVTCHNGTVIDVEAARVDDTANDGVRTVPESDHLPTFEVVKNDETPPFATPVTPLELTLTGKVAETTTFTSHEVCCQCYTYDEGVEKVYTHHSVPADYVATGKNVYPTVSFTPIQV